jgi:hypothetical protein
MHGREVLDYLDSQHLEWEDLDATGRKASEILRVVGSDPARLGYLFDRVTNDQRLADMAEHHDRIDKIILYDHLERGIRIRLHIYPPRHFDGPHNHRWPFTAFVLSGSYTHRLFAADATMDETLNLLALKPMFIREEARAGTYTIGPRAVHSVVAGPNTVSLILRGPAESQRLAMTDLKTGRLRWKYGRERESKEERSDRVMRIHDFARLRRHLESLSLISESAGRT